MKLAVVITKQCNSVKLNGLQNRVQMNANDLPKIAMVKKNETAKQC